MSDYTIHLSEQKEDFETIVETSINKLVNDIQVSGLVKLDSDILTLSKDILVHCCQKKYTEIRFYHNEESDDIPGLVIETKLTTSEECRNFYIELLADKTIILMISGRNLILGECNFDQYEKYILPILE